MKLLNKSLVYLSVSMFFIIGLWAVVFYFLMLNEIKDSVDEELENYKRQIVYKVQKDDAFLTQDSFKETFFAIRNIPKKQALAVKDSYIDTLMYMQDADDEKPELEPVRKLTTAFKKDDRYYELAIINSMVEEDDLVKELFRSSLGLYFLLILCVLLLNNFLLQRLWKPFYLFLNQLKKYQIGSHQHFPKVQTVTKEFSDLQNAVTILLEQNTKNYELQKQFIGNASHEMQTPLAIAMNKLELFVEKENLTTEQAEDIAEIINEVQRLIRLNKSLLLLTKIENKQFLDNQPVVLNNVFHQNLEHWEEIAAFKNIQISLSETTQLFVTMDPVLADVIVSNLLKNAVYHNIPNGTISVEILNKSIKICNTGSLTTLNKEKIFARFHKSNQSISGTGLGLAIVKAICDLYGFKISYHFQNNQHCFELQLK